MHSAAERSPVSPLSGRRLISRLASPFTSKSRSIVDYTVDVDEPHKQYSPGDEVSGSVKLRVLRPTRITHLSVTLHGFVQVYKNPGSPGERNATGYLGSGRGKKSGEYFGNGFASLFEDECVLCGDGRLQEGVYHFKFNLLFPDQDLPSSIDFERGTVTYMVTATLTRPTTMSPTMTADRKIYFVETIDISPLYPPKPRTITLEAISKRSRAKKHARKIVDASSRRSGSAQASNAHRDSNASGSRTESEVPTSPSPSQTSLYSLGSSRDHTSPSDGLQNSQGASGTSNGASVTDSQTGTTKCITAVIESPSGGCLRGDNLSVKVDITHTKPIKSINGVIVTLYRQARVDMHPAIPVGPTEKGSEAKYEDYYPKSVTGLGGLSLSGAGSSHLFRKDLAQMTAPLYVNPNTLTAEVTAKVRVPDEAFPTISTVPGAMISFKYFIEVLVDIQGKLATSDRNVAGMNIGPNRPAMGGLDKSEAAPAAPFGPSIMDTAPIRRDKGVVAATFEIIVGTRDSARRKGKRRVDPAQEAEVSERTARSTETATRATQTPPQHPYHGQEQWNGYWGYHGDYPQQYFDWHQTPSEYNDPNYWQGAYYGEPPPMSSVPDESQMSEKERIRQAETRLLPSQPPGMTPDDEAGEGASAPYLPPEGEDGPTEVAAADPSAPRALPLASGTSLHRGDHETSIPVPAYPNTGQASSSSGAATDDKQELRRRQLESEASAPPPRHDEGEGEAAALGAPAVPTEDEAYGLETNGCHDSHAEARGSLQNLPRYER